VNLIYSIY